MALCILICMCRWYGVYGVLTTGGIGRVVHSYGRLIPHEFPITDLQQISGPDGIGRITCTVSSGIARFVRPTGVTETSTGATSVLEVNATGRFHNRHMYCKDSTTNYFYIFNSATSELLHLRIYATILLIYVCMYEVGASQLDETYKIYEDSSP